MAHPRRGAPPRELRTTRLTARARRDDAAGGTRAGCAARGGCEETLFLRAAPPSLPLFVGSLWQRVRAHALAGGVARGGASAASSSAMLLPLPRHTGTH
jgi:hypothetical protein